MNRYLIVGHGAREYALSERLKKEGCAVFGVLKKDNSVMTELLDGSLRVRSYDPSVIDDACNRFKIDTILPTDESAIFSGTSSTNFGNRKVLAPRKEWLFLERDKEAFKSLVREIDPSFVAKSYHCPSFDVFLNFAHHFTSGFVLKAPPPSKDIVIFKEDHSERMAEIRALFEKYSRSGLAIEEFIDGTEFSIHTLFNESQTGFSKSIQDYPFLLDGNKGPKTGGMGAISSANLHLPSILPSDYEVACSMIKRIVERCMHKFGPTNGFFSFQFFKSGEKLLLNEVDIHPGDPEIIPLLLSLSTRFSDAISQVLHGQSIDWAFDSSYVVAQCFTPFNYPNSQTRQQQFQVEDKMASRWEAAVFWGNCTRVGPHNFLTGDSRTLSIAATGESFQDCRNKLINLRECFRGKLYSRTDIGQL